MTQHPQEQMQDAEWKRPFLVGMSLLLLSSLGCGVIGFVEDPAPLTGPIYWAAATGVPAPTVTIWLGTTTPVLADTAVPIPITTTPDWTTVTPIFLSTPTPYWVTTTPFLITETPAAAGTTTPGLPMIGYTTPEPLATPYYRIGTFYMNSDVYIGGATGLVFRITNHETQLSPQNENANYHYITLYVTNYSDQPIIVPVSDLFFIRHVAQSEQLLLGRWVPQNEPLIARHLPAYETQQLEPIPPNGERTFVLGFVTPQGDVSQLGLITHWERPLEGGFPVWFYLQDDPLGPFTDALQPPPPTPIVLDGGSAPPVGEPSEGDGLWPTTGIVTRGFGCHELYTGIDGAGFGCPAERPWFHNGVDIANTAGTVIWSPVAGQMLYAGPNSSGADCSHLAGSQPPHEGLGNYQRVRGSDTLHYFGHLRSFLVSAGDVAAEQVVAEMGSTGCSTGTHLHWMVYQHGVLLDPAQWAGPGPSP